MILHELIFTLALLVCCYVAAEDQKYAEDRIVNEFNSNELVLQKSEPLPENNSSQVSSLSSSSSMKVENRIDSLPAAGGYSGPQYLPPPSGNLYIGQDDCSPCNKEPWIPMASNIAQQTVISFVPPEVSSHISNLDYLHPPLPSYGKPSNQYGAPVDFRQKNIRQLPNPFKLQIGPSQNDDEIIIVDYMIPPPLNYRIPPLIYGPPKNPSGLPKPIYGPPKPIYGPPKPIYGPPKPAYGPPKPIYGSPKPIYGPPYPVYGPPPKPQYGPPTENIYGQLPPDVYFNDIIPEQFTPPPPPPNSFYSPPLHPDRYGPPQFNIPNSHYKPFPENYTPQLSPPRPPSINFNYDSPPPTLDYQAIPSISLEDSTNIPPAIPSDSYGAPVTGDSLNYLPPTEQLSSPSRNNEHLERPIPLPNLSFSPVAPIYNHGDFNQGFNNPQRSSNFHSGETQDGDVKIQKSVKIADYLATIEHPINVIQSPIVEVSVKENTDITSDNIRLDQNEKTYNNINEKLRDGYVNTNGNSQIDLSENPIIVEDVHPAASNINNSIVDIKQTPGKRTNDKQLSTDIFDEKQNVVDNSVTNLIKDLLLKQEYLGSEENHKYVEKVDNIDTNDHINNNDTLFTTPPLDYSNWQPSSPISSSSRMSTIFYDNGSTTTKKPKQIIIPYINKKIGHFDKHREYNNQHKTNSYNAANYNNDIYTTLLPMYRPPSSTETSVWSKFVDDINLAESKRVTATAFTPPTTAVYNIKELLSQHLPYDILSLQKNIDKWTHQAYSGSYSGIPKSTERLFSSKKIPDGYFTTQPYTAATEATTIINDIFDNYAVASSKNESFIKTENNDIDSNLLEDESTTQTTVTTTSVSSTQLPFPSPFSPKGQKSLWDVSHTTISPLTKEKVYVVTPQFYNFYTSTPATAWSMAPKIENGTVNNASTYDSHKFSIRVEPDMKSRGDKVKKDLKSAVKIVYSEWPHLINNLETTTMRPTSRHPLFGLMGISAYTPPPNSTVETIAGHSRVLSATTPSPTVKNYTTESVQNKATVVTTTERIVL